MRQSVNGEARGGEALDAVTIDGYRTANLSAGEVAGILGLATSLEALDWLRRRGIALNYSQEDYEADRETLARLLPESE